MNAIVVRNLDYADVGSGWGADHSKKIFFSFLHKQNNVYTLLHRSAMCRDILTDRGYNLLHANELNKDATRLYIYAPTPEIKRMMRQLPKLHKFEDRAGVQRTEFFQHNDNGIIVTGSPVWQEKVWKMSLYSFMIKRLAYVKGIPWLKSREETRYQEAVESNIDLLAINMHNTEEINSKNTETYKKYGFFWGVSSSGFYSILTRTLKNPQMDILQNYYNKHKDNK